MRPAISSTLGSTSRFCSSAVSTCQTTACGNPGTKKRACLNSIRTTCGNPGTKSGEGEGISRQNAHFTQDPGTCWRQNAGFCKSVTHALFTGILGQNAHDFRGMRPPALENCTVSSRRGPSGRRTQIATRTTRSSEEPMACGREQQHVVILVRKEGPASTR